MPRALAILFPIVLAANVLWLVMVGWLFHRLRTKRASTYEQIGRPDPFTLVLGFVLTPQWRKLEEPTIVRFMRIYFAFCLLLFGVLILNLHK